ncbi:MAG: glycosyltransferase family 2 protein [Bacteroidia bacterium]|nr:glycosyltransferase family 2 protein [Bacteroidia bacterium]
MIILNILGAIILAYLGLSAFYLLGYSLLAFLPTSRRDERLPEAKGLARIAVFIPAYKEDAVILHTARQSLFLDYPKDKWELVIIGDSLQPESLAELRSMPLTLVEVSFEQSTKSRALNVALDTIGDDFDLAFILDADNLAQKDILYKLNTAYQAGFKAIQGHRVAKNLNSAFAILDAMSEEINNRIFSSGHRAIGLSSRLVGSGMAFDYPMFKEIMTTVDAIGGFDKELELKLLGREVEVAYLPSAWVYDEKVSQGDHFTRQRRRWIAAQFHYAKLFFGKALSALIRKGNIDFFDKACQMILPPRLILPGVLFIGFVIALLVSPPIWAWLWGAAFAANALAFALAIPRSLYQPRYLKAFITLPFAFFSMALSLFKLKGSNKSFIHTPHSTTELTELPESEPTR